MHMSVILSLHAQLLSPCVQAQLNQANVRALKQQMLLLFKAQSTVNTAALKSLARTGATTGGLFLSTAAAAALGASPHQEHPDGASPSSSTADAQNAAQQALSQDALWQYATVDSRRSAAQGTVSGAHASHSEVSSGSKGALTRTTQPLTEDEALLLFAAAGQQRA